MQAERALERAGRVEFTRESILADYRIAWQSRQASLIGRKEVLTGKAKFGIFGDGKEVAQLAMARAFRAGDIRAGYYRDQTFMFATGMSTIAEFFAQLYADTDVEHDPASGGRSMNAHFATRMIHPDGSWRALAEELHSSADVSPTGSQMPRLLGLAYASKLYRQLDELRAFPHFSHHGDEIAFGTIGNASAAEGMFWESVNAAGVLQAPMLLSIWDDGFGISVPNELQMCKGNISAILKGFQRDKGDCSGFDLYAVKGWDYPALCETYLNASQIVRMEHVPAIIHVVEVTQPQGHSTSGSHERYKSKERLQWEEEFDCIRKMREWIVAQGIATAAELDGFEEEDRKLVREIQRKAWAGYRTPIDRELVEFVSMAREIAGQSSRRERLETIISEIERVQAPFRRDFMRAAKNVLVATRDETSPAITRLSNWWQERERENTERYGSDLYSRTLHAAPAIEPVAAQYDDDAPVLNGFEILNACFDAALARYPNVIALGEDVGKLGDVNQGFAGLQEKYGELRVSDTGIRECTIIGQAIGMAMRGLRPIAEIQYLDYLLYALQIISDDLATVRWRSKGGQKAPVIIRTRGHRLEGIWHSGSPMAGIISLTRGAHFCVPRNMTQAAGFYNTLLESDDPAIVVEVLNGYRAKEALPSNIGTFRVPLGVPEVIRTGNDVTIVTYGACCRIAMEAAELLEEVGIDAEIIDVQTLLPFDAGHTIVESLKKTSRVVFLDEDVPGGASAYMMQKVLEEQRGYEWLDSEPRTLPAKEHRPAYGSDGDYWSKPNRESVFTIVYDLMHEAMPAKYPRF
ncbi:MAG TPA: thiamine pyrophosphate-dependent enzyme [Thermoanaerobaculia bacterium]|nr:thiamine pyrophosphate-dependent enzyme [Thermoanaerobaculia bacterium]